MIEVDIDVSAIPLGFCARLAIKQLLGAEPDHVDAFYEQISA
jgi:hypothetical protein